MRCSSFDLSMWAIHNAKERDLEDWRQLVEDADTGFELTAVDRPEGSRLSIILVTWRGQYDHNTLDFG